MQPPPQIERPTGMTARRIASALAIAVCVAGCGSTTASKPQHLGNGVSAATNGTKGTPTTPQHGAFAALTSPGTQLQAPVQIPTHGIRLLPPPHNVQPNVPAATALANPVVLGMFGSKPATSLGVKLGVLYDDEIRHLNADGSSTKLYYGVTVWAVSGSVVSEPIGPSPGGGVGPHGETSDTVGAADRAHLVVFINAETGRYLFAVEGAW